MHSDNNIPEYIIAICPNAEVVKEVAALKQQLYDGINHWFSSYKSLAHITIEPFEADEKALAWRRERWIAFASAQHNQRLTFNSFNWFNEARTIFVAPDEASALWLKTIGDAYSESVAPLIRFSPHLTIGKGIKPHLFERAKQVFAGKPVKISFNCTGIALRKFNPVRRQYDIIERFYFPPGTPI